MNWPIDMPFPIFYKSFLLKQAEKLGATGLLKSMDTRELGKKLTWESMKKMRGIANIVKSQDRLSNQHLLLEEMFFSYDDCRTFLLSADLVEALKATDTRDIPQDLVKIPFDFIYIDVSSSPIQSMNDVNKCADSIRGIFVPSPKNWVFMDFCKKMGIDPSINLMGIPIEYAPGDTDGPGGFEANWCAGMLFWGAVDGRFKRSSTAIDHNRSNKAPPDLWNLWINSILYINSVNADIREGWLYESTAKKMKGKKGKRKRDMRRHLERGGRIFRVGHYISIPQISDGDKKDHQGGTINTRFMVRGHWHSFWTGSNRFGTKKKVLKWLTPYWKGPETADVVHGTYAVKERKDETEHPETDQEGEGSAQG